MKVLLTTTKGGFDHYLDTYDELLVGYKKATLCVDKSMYRVIDIESLDDLIDIQKRIGKHLIILDYSYMKPSGCDIMIEIYDYYRE